MHIEVVDDLNMIIYLNNSHIKSIDFSKKEDLQEYFQKLFINLKNYHNINMSGFYNINVYRDKYYGIIIELEKEDIDYMDYFNGEVDMNIVIENNSNFIYEIDDYFSIDPKIIDKVKIYKFKNKLYLQIVDFICESDIGKIIEFGRLVYGRDVDQVLKLGKELKINENLAIK